jgi:serine/threonine protein kinase
MVKTVGKYQIGKTLGEGTFGKVKFAINSETGEAVAIKVLDKEKIQKQSMGAQVSFRWFLFPSLTCEMYCFLIIFMFFAWGFLLQIKREISIMKLVSHKAIVKLTEVLASRTKIFIVLELVTGGEV